MSVAAVQSRSVAGGSAGADAYVVKSGDTLSSIAQAHGVSLSALEQANPQIKNPNLIYAGQHVTIPGASHAAGGSAGAASTYTVESGDTLSSIAHAHGVALSALESANPQIHNPNVIYPGQSVHIPAGGSASSGGGSHAGGGTTTYTVKSGDTLSGIGARFGVDWHVLAQINHLSNPNLIYAGEKLTISGSSGSSSGGGAPSGPSGPTGTGGATPGTLQGRINEAMRYFESQGWTRAQAAGIVANLRAESGVDPGRAQNGGGPGYGLAQWEGPRQASFRQWAGHDIHGSSFQEQLEFVQYELTHTESGAGSALRGATSASDAGAIVCRYYERPADTAGQSSYRAGLAQQIYASSAP
ncbi:MAG TPA: phage tail tip lysozyme [Dokdonella sp.]